MGVEIVDPPPARLLHGQTHAAHRAFAAGGHHVEAVGGGGVAHHLGVDLRAAGLGVLQRLEHHHAGPSGDDEAVAVLVVGAGGARRSVVVA